MKNFVDYKNNNNDVDDLEFNSENTNNDNGFKENPVKNHNKFNQPKQNDEVNYDFREKLIIDNKSENKKDTTYIFAMGGLEEIGKNMYAIEHNEELIVVDAGIKFASSELLGVNGLIPNFSYMKDKNKVIDKLIITHGHEDHIGAIPYMLMNCQINVIYAPLLASELIKRKLGEFKDIKMPEFEIFDDNSFIKTKYFEVDFFRVCHSIPDCFGMSIKTPNGIIASAGDYRFDFGTSVDNTDIHKIVDISKRGVDVFLCESTNSDNLGFSDSEDKILKNIEFIFKQTRSRIFISTFASNLARIQRIIEIAINLNRKICIMGRSMEANIKTSRKVGYLKLNDNDFVSGKEIGTTPDENLLIILTGSQGEESAALNLMAEGKYSKISLKPSDTILLSSNPIPGNFKNVDSLVNKLFKLGVNVIQHSGNLKIHASGHATKQEQQMMIKLLRPNYILPIHGESKMLKSLMNNAIEIGFNKENIIIVTNGQKLELKNKVLTKTNISIDASPILIEGKNANAESNELIKEREVISKEGIFNVILFIDKANKNLFKNPIMTTRGCFFAKESMSLISKISYSLKDEIEKSIRENQSMLNEDELTSITKKIINFFIWKNKKKKPFVLVTTFYK